MRLRRLHVGVVSLAVALGLFVVGPIQAQNPLEAGTVLDRMEIAGSGGMEAVLVLREIPPGGASGRHAMEAGSEIVYILEGAFIVEVEGKPAMTVEAGGTFQTTAGQVHNVSNASDEVGGKALVFYITKMGAALGEISLPAE